MKPQMTIAEALEFADEWSRGTTFYEGSQGWRVVCLLLAEEVRRLAQVEAEHEALEKAISDAVPVAWDVYVAEADNGYLVDSLDDPQLVDDCTNHGAVVTPLYTLEGIRTKP